jgi:RecA/RadA recombinase
VAKNKPDKQNPEEPPKEETKEEIQARIVKEIEKDFGKDIIIDGNEIIERPQVIIPFSPAIDSIIGGGVPEGSWIIIVGKEKCGKSTSALHFSSHCQMPEYGGRNIYYLNVEGRLKKRDLLGIPKLNHNKIKVVQSTEDKILSSQDYLQTAEKILHTEKGGVLIIDSVSQLCDSRELTGGVGTETRGSGAKLFSQFTNQMSNVVNVKKHIIICILQLRANTSGYGLPTMEKGGNAVQYQVDIKLRAEKVELLCAKEGADPYGQIVTWKCLSAALGPPGRKCESYIRYGEGIDELHELIIDASHTELIRESGTWRYFDFLKDVEQEEIKFQGYLGARNALAQREDWQKVLYERIKERLS